MKFLKQSGKMFVFLSVIAVVFGFFGNLSFAAEPNSDITCNAKPLDGVCKEAGKECTPGAGYQKYGHCDKVDAPCCVPDANVPKSGSTPITTKTECEATKGSDGKNAYCITTVGQNCSTFSLDQIGTCADLGSGTACCAAKGTPVPGGSTSSTPSSSASSLQYAPLENLPGFEGESGDFATYFKNVYLLALWIVGISALFMLVVGGFLYLSSAGNTSTLGYAKKTIYGALIGLVIALISWLLLNTINADLTNLKLSGLSGVAGLGGGSSTTTTPPSGNADPEGCKNLKNLRSDIANQCNLASKELVAMMSCMEGKGIKNTWTSISASNIGGDQNAAAACCGDSRPASCKHSKVTCHYGCTFGTKGLSYGVDIGGLTSASSDATLCAVASAAKSCGGGNIWGPRTLSCGVTYQDGHNDHLHVSVSGCPH